MAFSVTPRELRESARARVEALRLLTPSIAQAAVAAGAAWYLAHDVIDHKAAFFAPIAALIALGVGAVNRTRRAVELTLGVAVGILVGDLFIGSIGSGAWQVGVIVFLSMAVAVLLAGGPLFISQAASSGVLVATIVGGDNVSRFVDALVGGAVGIAVLIAIPQNPVRSARRTGARVFDELAAVLEDVASALERRDVAAMREALARARTTEADVVRWRQALTVAQETTRLSPLYWSARSRIDEYAVAAADLELAVRNARVLARAGIRAVELDPELPPELPAAVRQLAAAVRAAQAALEVSDRSNAIEAAVQAATLATYALDRNPDLTVAHVVGQVRALTSDLLRALGLDQATASERVRRATRPGD